MDHGSQYLSDHFTNQIKFWGIQPSYAFVAEPQTNGVAERFNRNRLSDHFTNQIKLGHPAVLSPRPTSSPAIIHGRIYRNMTPSGLRRTLQFGRSNMIANCATPVCLNDSYG